MISLSVAPADDLEAAGRALAFLARRGGATLGGVPKVFRSPWRSFARSDGSRKEAGCVDRRGRAAASGTSAAAAGGGESAAARVAGDEVAEWSEGDDVVAPCPIPAGEASWGELVSLGVPGSRLG